MRCVSESASETRTKEPTAARLATNTAAQRVRVSYMHVAWSCLSGGVVVYVDALVLLRGHARTCGIMWDMMMHREKKGSLNS